MIEYHQTILDNGLRLFILQDPTSPMAVVNILYDVGSKDEDESRTGFAHLFEHLMFGGSVNIPSYDTPLQKVGGENNAFTTPDVTNYYLTLPSVNLETGFWLESDRMLGLSFNPEVLEVQRKVVIEEFKQRYLDQPYGDAWLKLRPLAYKEHPYQWATIGKDISHIQAATMDDVKHFFNRFYHPANAILVVGGDVDIAGVQKLADKWFAGIPAGPANRRNLKMEPVQQQARLLEVSANVPVNAFYQVYHMPKRFEQRYYQTDLFCDILGRGKSSRLYQSLVKEKNIFSSISAHVTGSLDPGLVVIHGKLTDGKTCEQGHQEVAHLIAQLLSEGVSSQEVQKVKNQAESSLAFSEVTLLNRCLNLAMAAVAGDPQLVNQEIGLIRDISDRELMDQARIVFKPENSSTLYYKKQSA